MQTDSGTVPSNIWTLPVGEMTQPCQNPNSATGTRAALPTKYHYCRQRPQRTLKVEIGMPIDTRKPGFTIKNKDIHLLVGMWIGDVTVYFSVCVGSFTLFQFWLG